MTYFIKSPLKPTQAQMRLRWTLIAAGAALCCLSITSRLSAAAPNLLLSSWRFEAADLASEQGQRPLRATNVLLRPSFAGTGAEFRSSRPAVLEIPITAPSGAANLDVQQGAVRFWYKPYWFRPNHGTGPGDWARLVEAGGLKISINPEGTRLIFQTEPRPGQVVTNLEVETSFYKKVIPADPNFYWHEIILNYSKATCFFVIDGETQKNATAPGPYGFGVEGPLTKPASFTIGSGADGRFPAQGLIDELETFGEPVGPLQSQIYSGPMRLEAMPRLNPPAIELRWQNIPENGLGDCVTIRRKKPAEVEWTVLTNICRASVYVDRAVEVGGRYEYEVGPRRILAGLRAAPIEQRGRLILLVDETLAKPLAPSLRQLEEDLTGDGWATVRHDVPRHNDGAWRKNTNAIARIKQLIVDDWRANPAETKAVFIVGHVAVPYSGLTAEDGHFLPVEKDLNHNGAWPADSYYGDIDGVWTDSRANLENRFQPRLENIIGDGKFDQIAFENNQLELAVGRVDFWELQAFRPKGEVELMRQYLEKDHAYRFRLYDFGHGAIVADYFGEPFHYYGRKYYEDALRLAGRSGPEASEIVVGDMFAQKTAYLWGFQGGFGGYNVINVGNFQREHSTRDLVGREVPVSFWVLGGSFFGDWNTPDNLLRAALAETSYGLGAMFGHFIDWRFEPLGLGEPIGAGLVLTSAAAPLFPPYPKSVRTIFLLGDPTLRMQILPPAENLKAAAEPGGKLRLTWSGSIEPGASYFVYRSMKGMAGPFQRVSAEPVTGTTWVDPTPGSATPKQYAVRALKLIETRSGSFTNLSQAVFVETR